LCYHPRKKTRLAASHHKPSGTWVRKSVEFHTLANHDCLLVPCTGCGCMIMTKINCFSTGII
jgi:hypothetical protein